MGKIYNISEMEQMKTYVNLVKDMLSPSRITRARSASAQGEPLKSCLKRTEINTRKVNYVKRKIALRKYMNTKVEIDLLAKILIDKLK